MVKKSSCSIKAITPNFCVTSNPGGISENRHWRMIEVIEFAFGQSIYSCAIEEREGTKLTIGLSSPIPGLKTEGQLVPPFELRGKIHHYPIGDLARRFYQYVLSYKEGLATFDSSGALEHASGSGCSAGY